MLNKEDLIPREGRDKVVAKIQASFFLCFGLYIGPYVHLKYHMKSLTISIEKSSEISRGVGFGLTATLFINIEIASYTGNTINWAKKIKVFYSTRIWINLDQTSLSK